MKERLIEESIKLFVKKGYNATTIENITKKTGTSKGTFYWYLKSKEDLLTQILERYEHNYVDWIIAQTDGAEGDFRKKYKYLHKLSTEFAYLNRNLCVVFTTLAAEFSGSRSAPERKIKGIYQKYRAFLEGLIEQGKREGHVRPEIDGKIAAHLLNAMNSGNLLEWYMNYGEIDGELLAKTYREVTLSGILAPDNGG